MTNKQKTRLWHLILAMLAGGSLLTFILVSLNQQVLFFLTPSQLHQQEAGERVLRLGGIVKVGSVIRAPKDVVVHFVITDYKEDQEVYYQGILPDLFREGQGVIAEGKMDVSGLFRATHVLAKHDENYMPQAVYQQLRQSVNDAKELQ